MRESTKILLTFFLKLDKAKLDMLLDTSGLLCCLDSAELRHRDAITYFEAGLRKVTHNYVLVEFVALAQARKYPRDVSLSFVADVATHPDIEVIWVDENSHAAALALLRAQLDKSYSLCDAISFLLMRERGIEEALTTDKHFEQAGFRRLLADPRM
jgi:predicted nucleic acid-binding protein